MSTLGSLRVGLLARCRWLLRGGLVTRLLLRPILACRTGFMPLRLLLWLLLLLLLLLLLVVAVVLGLEVPLPAQRD